MAEASANGRPASAEQSRSAGQVVKQAHLVLLAMNIALFGMFAASPAWIVPMTAENGWLESAQAALLAAAMVAFGSAALFTKHAIRSAGILLAALCCIAFLRELDFRTLPFPGSIDHFMQKWSRNIMFAAIGLFMLGYAYLRLGDLRGWIELALNKRALSLAIALSIFAVSVLADYYLKNDAYAQIVEELLEINGAGFIAIAGLRHFMFGRAVYRAG